MAKLKKNYCIVRLKKSFFINVIIRLIRQEVKLKNALVDVHKCTYIPLLNFD
jgi:hypothetical protein